MLKKIVTASLAVGMLVVHAPAAPATSLDVPTFGCWMTVVQHHVGTGQSYEGYAYGYVVHTGDPGDTGAILRCYVTVNGVEATTTPTRMGAVADRLTFSAHDTDVVMLHAEGRTSHGSFGDRYETVHQEVPPEEINDAITVKIIRTV